MALTGAQALARHGITAEPVTTASGQRFPDGAHFRIEIPSVEGPEVLRAVIDQAKAEGITVNRVSQGSGAMLLSAAELDEMAAHRRRPRPRDLAVRRAAGGMGRRQPRPVRRGAVPRRADPGRAAAQVRHR